MPSQRFDISILLNVLSQGKEEIDAIGEAFKKLEKQARESQKSLENALSQKVPLKEALELQASLEKVTNELNNVSKTASKFKLFDRKIGGTESLNDILRRLQEIEDKAKAGLSLDLKTDIKELNVYLERLEAIRKAAIDTDDKGLFNQLSTSINQATELRNILAQLEKISIDKNISSYKSLLDEATVSLKQNLKLAELLSSTGLNPQALQGYIKNLENARDTFKILSDEAAKLGVSTVIIDKTIENLNGKIDAFKSGTPAKIGTIQGLSDVIAQLDNLRNSAKAGIPINFSHKEAELNLLEQSLIQIRAEAVKNGNVEIIKDATDVLTTIEGVRKEFIKIQQIQLDKSITPFKIELREAAATLKDLSKQGQNLIDTGADTTTLQALRARILAVRGDLLLLRQEAEKLGKSTVDIDIKLTDASKLINQLDIIDHAQIEIKRDEIDLKVKNKLELDKAVKSLKELNKELDEAIQKRDYKAIDDIERRADKIQALHASLAPKIKNSGNAQAVNVFSGFTQGLNETEDRLADFTRKADGGFGRVLNNVGARIRNSFRDAGGANATIKATAGTFRLLGNAAFVVGGELRTLGFGFNAIGTVIQNFIPLIGSFASSLGLASIPLIALGVQMFAAVVQGLALGAVLAAIAKTGLQFNDAFARTRNNIAGIVGLFFEITENGRPVGEGLDDISAAQTRLAATSVEVSKELRALTFEALTTEFTTEELFPAFNAVATSASKLAPDLETLRVLTGGLARVSSVAGVSASNLGSAITQLISGTGRVTNPLQRFFNQIKDSSGIELTSKRIKELRAAGGDKLLNELLLVTEKFGVLGQEQAKTLSGSFSNIVDAFQLFSGEATQKAYDTLRGGFERIRGLVTEQVQLTRRNSEGILEKVTVGPKGKERPLIVSQFTKPIVELQRTLDNLFNKVSQDFLGFLSRVINYFVNIGQYLTDNYASILSIYENLKLIGIQVANILVNFLRITTLTPNASRDTSEWLTILKVVNAVLFGIRLTLIGIGGLIGAVFGFLADGAELYFTILSKIPGYGEIFKPIIPEIAQFSEKMKKSFIDTGKAAQEARDDYENVGKAIKELNKPKSQKVREVLNIPEFSTALTTKGKLAAELSGKRFTQKKKVNQLLDQGYTAEDIIGQGVDAKFVGKILYERENKYKLKPTGVNAADTDTDKKGKSTKDKLVDLRQEEKKNIEARIALNKAFEDSLVQLTKDRLSRQQSLLQAQLDLGIAAQAEATAKTLVFKQQEIAIETRAKLNDIARAKEKQKLVEESITSQENRIIASKIKEVEKEGKLKELEIERNTSRLEFAKDIKTLETDILQIRERQLSVQLDTIVAQFNQRKDLLKQNAELKNSLAELGDATAPETLAAKQRNIVQEQAEQVRQLDLQLKNLRPSDFSNLGIFAGAGAFLQSKKLLGDNLNLLKEQLEIRVQLARFDFIQNVLQTRQNELRLAEDTIQQNLAEGNITEFEAAVQTRIERLKTVEALRLANAELKKNGKLTEEQNQAILENNLTIRKLAEELPDAGILDVTRSIGDGFTNLFEKLQEDVGDAKNAFRDLANSILGSFRRLIAQRLSEEIFDKLLTPKGKFGEVLTSLGLSRTNKINQEASARAATQTNEALTRTNASFAKPPETAEQILARINREFEAGTQVFTAALKILAEKINSVSLAIPAFSLDAANRQAIEAQNFNILTAIGREISYSTFVENQMLVELKNIASLLASNATTSANYDFGSIIPEEKNGGLIGKLKYFAHGGAARGKDVIPAYLSNGEFVFTPEMVRQIGLPVLDYLNKFGKLPKFAGGGLFENFGLGSKGASSFAGFDFTGGGAKLLNKPAAIIEKIIPKKKTGKLRNIFGNILSFAAPFLNFIPGIGPFLALGAGAAGGALTGSTKGKLGGILGGIFGGLSNLGGFAKSSGFLGSLSRQVGSPTGQAGLSLFSGLLGNSGGALGQATAAGIKNGKFSSLFKNLKGLGGSAFLKKIFGFFDKFQFGKSFDLSSILGKKSGGIIPALAEGGQADIGKLLGLFGLFSSISKLFGGNNQPEFEEEIIDDPDASRKNLFGSAYSKLIESGFIPDFQYSAETLKKLQNQFNGIKNLVRIPKQSFFSKIFELLPSLAGLLNFGGGNKGNAKDIFASVGTAFRPGVFADGGMVSGAGTATSDSILSLIKPESFVLRASSVAALEDGLLRSIDSQIFRFADGGSVNSNLLKALPDLVPSVTTGNQNVSIHNYADFDSAFAGYLSTPQAQKKILNTISRNKNGVNGILRGRR